MQYSDRHGWVIEELLKLEEHQSASLAVDINGENPRMALLGVLEDLSKKVGGSPPKGGKENEI